MTSWSVRLLEAARDELAVDLQVVERQVLEVVERAEARAEVVEREAAAELREALGEAPRERDVRDRRGLGDLEDQAPRVDVGARELALDEVQQRRVVQRRARTG